MRVAHLLRKLDPAEWSGTEMAIQRLLDGLRAHGVTPVVYCPRLETDGDDPLVQSGFDVRRYKAFLPVLGLSPQRRKQMVAVGGNLMSLGLIPALWREKDLDLVHTHTLGRLGGIALTLARKRGLPFVVTIHGGVLDLPDKIKKSFNAPNEEGWEWGRLFGVLFRSHRLFVDADAILTCNEQEATLLRQQLPDKRIVVQPHGVPLEIYRQEQREAARAAFPQIRDRDVLLCLGRIDPVKNQAWLLEQAPALLQRHPNTLLVLAGPCTDEPYGKLVEQTIDRLGLRDRVLLTGPLPSYDPRLIGLLQSAVALILPSLSETFGLVILEAWAAGTMVLTTRASGPAALVEHGQNGWMFELDRPETFHRALDQTLADPELAREMVRRGARVSERYGVNLLAGRLKLLYEQICEEKHAVRNHS